MSDTEMKGKGTKTGLHRAKHARKPEVARILFDQDSGKMLLERPKSVVNQNIGIFEGYRAKLEASPSLTPQQKSMLLSLAQLESEKQRNFLKSIENVPTTRSQKVRHNLLPKGA
jgi:hypothetical protein